LAIGILIYKKKQNILMATYSIGNPPTDATKLTDITEVLSVLPDNTSKAILPKDIRDSVYTVWENSIFKPTTIPSFGTSYIGIDQNDIQSKIFLGKKTANGQYIMNSNLLANSTDVDIFFYNTRTEPTSNYDTKIAILAGTGSNFQGGDVSSPFLQSKVVTTVNGSYLNFEIGNSSYVQVGLTKSGGDINIKSDNGNISLNGVVFPKYSENQSVTDGYVLTYRNPGGTPLVVWEAVATQSTSASLISAGTVSISGSPVLLNGQNINFTDATPIPSAVGSIPVGATFSNVPVVEMIRRILYPYVAPTLATTVQTTGISPASTIIFEAGNSALISNAKLNYTINRSAATYSITTISITGGAYVGSLPVVGSITTGTTTGFVNVTVPASLSGTASYNSTNWVTTITDAVTTRTSPTTIKTVIPWYYGTATVSHTTSTIINILNPSTTTIVTDKLTPLITEPATSVNSSFNKTVNFSGSNKYIYFGYPSDFPDLVEIRDHTNNNIFNAFTKWVITGVNAPAGSSGVWTGKSYKFYIYNGSLGIAPATTNLPTPYGAWTFKFA
jgi:hypothetical protein